MNCVEIGAKLFTNSPIMSTGTISIKSECNEFFIPVRGKGGSVIIEHKGDLSLGEIASSFTYSRQITITNSGSIASTMDFVWLVMGRSESEISSYVQLEETFSALDPRGGWAKGIVLKERAVATGSPITSREYWQIIRRSVVRSSQSKFVGFRSDIRLPKVWEDALDKVLESIKSKNSAEDKIHHRRTSSNIRKTPVAHQGQNTSFYKRRQMLYHLITNTVVSSQSSSRSASFISVSPSSATLPKFGEVNLKIDINLSTEETFLATLLVRSTIHNVPTYEIPLTAQPMAVHIVCSDTGILNFNRQPIGESEVMSRTFSNVGHKDIRFVIQNTNSSLSIEPDAGNLKVGETVSVIFTFTARNENIEQNDILFEPDCSQPIRIRFYGGGGTVKCSLGKYKRFDFGQCMIAKDTISYLPIINEGTACIHLTTFDLEESVTFFKGSNWPVKRLYMLTLG